MHAPMQPLDAGNEAEKSGKCMPPAGLQRIEQANLDIVMAG